MSGDGLADFGTGAFQGGATGATIGSAGGPYGTAIGAGIGAIAGGALSYFGGASQRDLERKNNRKAFASMDQEAELGDLNISEARRQQKAAREQDKRKKMFGELLAQYFQKQQGAV